MPRAVLSIKARIRDHSISLPAPETTARFDIPNACTDCHADRTPAWAESQLVKWFPEDRSARVTARAEAFTLAARAGRSRYRSSWPRRRPERAPLHRANALGHLGRFPDPRSVQALVTAAGSGEPILRAIAVMNLEPAKLSGPTARRRRPRSSTPSAIHVASCARGPR